MEIGFIGLGKMGARMTARLQAAGHTVHTFDVSEQAPRTASSLSELVAAVPAPRVIWVMVPAGVPTTSTIEKLASLLSSGDLVIDGGNSNYHDAAKHAELLAQHGIGFLDVGVSGGVWGKERGYALMVGGKAAQVAQAQPLFDSLKPAGDSGFVHAGPTGAGHFAKMVHNGIEYGMMQAFGEGFATLTASELTPDPAAILASWQSGSVVSSWLLELLVRATTTDPTLTTYPPVAAQSGEAQWMVEAAMELGVPVPATTAALFARLTSQGGADPALQAINALRNQFGGHATS